MTTSATLTPDELAAITGYRLAGKQLAELHRQGFWRARRSPMTGGVILERAHYEAVCAGERAPKAPAPGRPQLRLSAA